MTIVCRLDEIEAGTAKKVVVDGVPVAVVMPVVVVGIVVYHRAGFAGAGKHDRKHPGFSV